MYSPIEELEIKDFRNLGNVRISFRESPIVCLLGENEAGKTSVIKAFTTCALHADPRAQKNYIRNGTQMFGVAIKLQDGTQVVRMKTPAVNLYRVVNPDGTKWETSKIAEGLPVEVQRVMGLIVEPETKEFLHVRTYEDQLLFVVTPASANYKVMYNALKVEQITNAIKKGSDEANKIRGVISDSEKIIQSKTDDLAKINVVDLEHLTNTRERLTKQIEALNKLELALSHKKKIEKCNEELGILRLIDTFKLQDIDVVKTYNLNSVYKLLNNISNLKERRSKLDEVINLSEIDLDYVNKSKCIIDKINELNSKKNKAGSLILVNDLSEINEGTVRQLERARQLVTNVVSLESRLKALDTTGCNEIDLSIYTKVANAISRKQYEVQLHTSLDSYNNAINQILAYMKQCGVAFEICPNCGNDVLIDLDKVGGLENGRV